MRGLVSLPKPGLDLLMQCRTQTGLSAPFHEAEIRLRDAEHLGRLDLRQAEHQPPAFELLSEGRRGGEGAGERSFMPSEALIRCANDLWGFEQHCGSPPLRHIEFLILPGGNSPISQNSIEGFLKPRFLPSGTARNRGRRG